MALREYVGGAVVTTITGNVAASGSVTINIADSTGWTGLTGGTGKFAIVVDEGTASEEKMLVTSRSSLALSVDSADRGYNGTSAKAHSTGATIRHCLTSLDVSEPNAHIAATSGAHAATAISFSPIGNIAATTVQAAIAEVDSETDARLDAIEANNWVTTARITDANVTTAKIADLNVTAGKLAADAVTTAKILDANVTPAKYAPTLILDINRTAAQAIGAGVTAAISFDTETTDTASMFTATSSTITASATGAGLWQVDVVAISSASAAGSQVIIQHNGTPQHAYTSGPTVNSVYPAIAAVFRIANTETINILVKNGTAGSLDFTPTLKITRLAA